MQKRLNRWRCHLGEEGEQTCRSKESCIRWGLVCISYRKGNFLREDVLRMIVCTRLPSKLRVVGMLARAAGERIRHREKWRAKWIRTVRASWRSAMRPIANLLRTLVSLKTDGTWRVSCNFLVFTASKFCTSSSTSYEPELHRKTFANG